MKPRMKYNNLNSKEQVHVTMTIVRCAVSVGIDMDELKSIMRDSFTMRNKNRNKNKRRRASIQN